MNSNELVTMVKHNLNRVGFVLSKKSPEILIVAGAIGTITAAVMACKASIKLPEVLEDSQIKLSDLHMAIEDGEEMTEKEMNHELTKIYVETAVDVAKLYAPSVVLGILSMGTVFASNNILRQRNASIAAAYATVDSAFRRYRHNVVDQYGGDIDKAMRYGIKKQEIEEVVIDAKGKEKIVKKTVDVSEFDPSQYSDFARFFDESCYEWDKDPEYNLTYLRCMQQSANNLLQSKGHLFLNEVYDMLGIQRTKAGQVVGWIFDDKNPVGDNYVDFGMYDLNRSNTREFVNGHESRILLDFNVDGDILNKI